MTNLQQWFHGVQKLQGRAAALQALAMRVAENPRYVRQTARAILRSAELTSTQKLLDELKPALAAAQERARLYVRFRQLSQRQQTKAGGFKAFVVRELGSRWETCHPLLRAGLGRTPFAGRACYLREAGKLAGRVDRLEALRSALVHICEVAARTERGAA